MSALTTLRWLSTALWLGIALAYAAFFLIDLRLDFEQVQRPCSGAGCNYLAVSAAEFEVFAAWGVSPLVYAFTMTVASLAGAVVCWALAGMVFLRRGASPLGWAVSLALVIIPVTLIADVDNLAVNIPVLFLPSAILNQVGSTVFLLFLYVFPNGRLYPRVAFVPLGLSIFAFGALSIITGYPGIGSHSQPVIEATIVVVLAMMLVALTFQILRYRNVSTPLERQQTKWVILGIVGLMAAFPLWFVTFGGLVAAPPGAPRLLLTVGGWLVCIILINALPITLAMAIMRYRLWDIDLVIRRTLTYSLLSALLVSTYLGSVLVLQSGLRAITGEGQSQLVTVLSTLAIAALVVPLHRRVQAFIDRRFFRRKYDAARALAAFAATARDETNLARLSEQLVDVVEETMQPESVVLWLRPPAAARAGADS